MNNAGDSAILLIMRIADLYRPIFKIWRANRQERFRRIIDPKPGERILDVGGYPHTWIGEPQVVEEIICLNLRVYPWKEKDQYPGHRIEIKEGDGCALEYPTDSFPIIFSNSVIEHVGDYAAQEAFAREARRVGGRLWVQTPAYECPIEPHYLTPFMHWYPKGLRRRLARWFTVWGLLEKPTKADIDEMVDYTRLLTKGEMKRLFPDCRIITERLLWVIPKSYIAVRV